MGTTAQGNERAIDLAEATLIEAPFAHFTIDRCLSETDEATLLDWLEGDAPWRLVETDFYEQYEFSVLDVALPPAIAWLASAETHARLTTHFSRLFGRSFEKRITLVAHKLLRGQRIAIHNDHLVGEETHRLTVQLNRGMTDADGGIFMLFSSFDPADVHQLIRPTSASALGFAIGPNSHHAVSRVHGGERFTLVFSFYALPNDRR